ncbi:PaaX family transcriptional regulator C-terminal domain-containing protein [Streptomyces hygroscopicus]|uniref:PaaX family transcriptional regulator n=1 Tax=Streptomyces hygroscopicus TaxID=1912 RepID=UPI0036279739
MTTALESAAPSSNGRDPRPGSLIMTLFGLYARSRSNWLSVSALVRLMADLGVEGAAVRSAVSRMKRRGVLTSERHAGAAGYALAAPTLETLAEGDARIFERTRADTADGWILVVFSVPESEREKRYELRTSLTRLGFGTAAPGIWIAPGNLKAETERALDRRGLSAYVDIFTGHHVAFGDLRSKVRIWWDLDELTELYANFLRHHRPLLDSWSAAESTPQDAFRAYIPLLTQWRQLPYRDPGLPLALLPPGWNGVTAGEVFDELNRLLSAPAREHALAAIRGA